MDKDGCIDVDMPDAHPKIPGSSLQSAAALFEQCFQTISKGDRFPSCIRFSRDGRVLLATSGNCVDVISPTGGRLFALEGHTQLVTDIALHPLHTSQVYTASLDGTLRLWDFSDGAAIQTWPLDRPLRHIVIGNDAAAAYVTLLPPSTGGRSEKPRTESFVHRVDLSTGHSTQLFRCRAVARLAIAASGMPLLAVAGRELLVWRDADARNVAGEEDRAEENPARFAHVRTVGTVAVHPDGAYIAVGDDRGEILLWHNILTGAVAGADGGQGGLPFCGGGGGRMHWHAHATRSMCVSSDGAYLVSGGEEAVLVQWQVHSCTRNHLNASAGLSPLRGAAGARDARAAAIPPLLTHALAGGHGQPAVSSPARRADQQPGSVA
jgi:NET1-associated nuclear protein 1 (U3 small nucleolar RNA-associated protein 17)